MATTIARSLRGNNRYGNPRESPVTLKKFLDPFRLRRSTERERLERQNTRKPLIVVGLANPGPKYRATRHNVGGMCVEELARRAGVKLENRVRDTDLAEAEIGEAPAVLARPIAYVNESGKSVRNLLRKFNAEPDRLLVIVDDMDLKIGRLRLRESGSSGGHNGLRSVREATGTDGYARLRIGVGRPAPGVDPVEHVLGRFRPDEREIIERAVARAADAVEAVQRDGIERAMDVFNQPD